jgi:hypothetical protein
VTTRAPLAKEAGIGEGRTMLRPLVVSVLAVLALGTPPKGLDGPDDDTTAHFPALQTTIADPQVDGGLMHRCSVLDGQRLCDEQLGEAWCRKQGFGGGFVEWRTSPPIDKTQCMPDARSCSPVRSITCRGVPIVGD